MPEILGVLSVAFAWSCRVLSVILLVGKLAMGWKVGWLTLVLLFCAPWLLSIFGMLLVGVAGLVIWVLDKRS